MQGVELRGGIPGIGYPSLLQGMGGGFFPSRQPSRNPSDPSALLPSLICRTICSGQLWPLHPGLEPSSDLCQGAGWGVGGESSRSKKGYWCFLDSLPQEISSWGPADSGVSLGQYQMKDPL